MNMHETYLRFTLKELDRHFADVKGVVDREKYSGYFTRSLAFSAAPPPVGSKRDLAKYLARANQLQKDERFWIADTLMTLFHRSGDRSLAFATLIEKALPGTPLPAGHESWRSALGGPDDLELYFEVSLPATAAYQEWLADHLAERSLIPWIRDAALTTNKRRLEGPTKTDAMLISRKTHVAVIFEAKVLSDTSVQVGYDAARNQLARTIDVMLENDPRLMPPLNERDIDATYLVLLTPQLFKDDTTTRLYGWLMDSYRRDNKLLSRHLGHRAQPLPEDVPQRIGWVSWEECRAMFPNTCPWLGPTNSVARPVL